MVGGDAIGPRPVNFHLDALKSMGAIIEETETGYRASAPKGLHGAVVTLPYPSVGATENVILASPKFWRVAFPPTDWTQPVSGVEP